MKKIQRCQNRGHVNPSFFLHIIQLLLVVSNVVKSHVFFLNSFPFRSMGLSKGNAEMPHSHLRMLKTTDLFFVSRMTSSVQHLRLIGWFFVFFHGNPSPQCHPPPEIAGLIKGLLTIGFP